MMHEDLKQRVLDGEAKGRYETFGLQHAIAEQIISEREKQGLSQAELANKMNVELVSVQGLEMMKDISLYAIEEAAVALGRKWNIQLA